MRIVVVGGGVIGLLTAIECVRAGALVDLVDRADIPAPEATSNDHHRVVRALHRGSAPLTAAAARCHDAWRDVESLLGTRFHHRVGALYAMPPAEAHANVALLVAAGASARFIAPDDLTRGYPRLRFAAGLAAVAEPDAGAVLAGRALTAMADWLREHPRVRAHPHRPVVEIDETGTVHLADGGTLTGERVVVAAGPWSRGLLPDTVAGDLTLYRQTMLSYDPRPTRDDWAAMPAIPSLGTATGAWLMPPVGGTPARLSAASACRPVNAMTDRVTPDEWRNHLVEQFRTLLTDFDSTAVTGADDGYYLSDDTGIGPRLAALHDETVWAYVACGGMSFKFAPLIARALADRALGRPPGATGLEPIDSPRQFTAARPRARRNMS